MAALTAMKSMRQRLSGRQGGLTYEVEVVAQHAGAQGRQPPAELPLPSGARAVFLLKRRQRLCVTEPAEVDASGGVEWNTRCTQTATLFKEGGASGGWRPKEFVFKVQAVRDAPRLGQEAGQTVAKAALDLSQFCQAEPFGPKQLVLQLQPAGLLHVCVRTQWLQHFDREADTLTDVSCLSYAPSAVTSVVGPTVLEAEQDLSGFDGAAAAAAAAAAREAAGGLGAPGGGAGTIKAVYPGAAAPQQGAQQGGTPGHQRRHSAAGMLRLPRRGGSFKEQQPSAVQQQQQQPPQPGGQRFQFAPTQGGAAAPRRPPGASKLLLPAEPAQPLAGAAAEAATPTLLVGAQRKLQLQAAAQGGGQQVQQGRKQEQQAPAAVGLPRECWSPVDLQEAVDRLYDSEEEPTPRASVLGTVRRMFGRARHATPPLPPGTTARQLHAHFGTPAPSPPKCTPNPGEVATIDREGSVSSLRWKCKRLLAERDEARAEGYAEAALAVEQGVEIDKLRRAKDMLLQRLQATEEQLLATFRDEASTDLIQALAAARVEAAQREFQVMELQGQLRRRDGALDRLRAQLTRVEAKYRTALNSLSPGARAASPWASSPADSGGGGRPGGAAASAASSLRFYDNPLSSPSGSTGTTRARGQWHGDAGDGQRGEARRHLLPMAA